LLLSGNRGSLRQTKFLFQGTKQMLTTVKIDIDSLVNSQLPAFPASAMRVMGLVQNINASTRAVADAIGSDPALAAQILRTANSPLYSQQSRITSLPVAVGVLGSEVIHLLVMITAASTAFAKEIRTSEIGHKIWEHSLTVAHCAREVSVELGLRGVEEAFICGLLHDIGKFMMLKHNATLYSMIKEKEDGREVLEFERLNFDFTHSQIGALVAKRWKLPEEISYVIAYHHQPGEAGKYMLMSRVIDVADMMANNRGFGVHTFERDLSAAESIIGLGLTDAQLEVIWERTSIGVQSFR
jgi:putative nucleotidyltransferase with HDIG domain